MDANDHRPVFSARTYEGTVSEAVAPGATVLTLQCRDRDQSPTASSSVYFTLHHAQAVASQGLFTVDSFSGDLIVAEPLDRLDKLLTCHIKRNSEQSCHMSTLSAHYETCRNVNASLHGREVSSVHELTVSCRDRGRLENADFARVSVTVEDANDHEPVFLEPMISAKVSTVAATHALLKQNEYALPMKCCAS